MTLATVRPLAHDWWVLDRSYERTKLGPDVRAWLAWLELDGASPATLDQYERDLSRLCIHHPRKRIDQLTDLDVSKTLLTWPRGSRRVRKAAISSFFNWARKQRRVRENPMDLVANPKRNPKPLIRTFTDSEEQLLLALPLIDSALMCVLLDTGIRKAGARNLQVRFARPETGYVVVTEKGDETRPVPMSDRLQVKLAELILLEGLNPDDYLWYNRPGGGSVIRRDKPIGNTSFTRWWERCLTAAGVDYRKPHTTRHTYATEWRRDGLELDDLKMLLGHKSIATTEAYYLHGDIRDVADRMKKIERRMRDARQELA